MFYSQTCLILESCCIGWVWAAFLNLLLHYLLPYHGNITTSLERILETVLGISWPKTSFKSFWEIPNDNSLMVTGGKKFLCKLSLSKSKSKLHSKNTSQKFKFFTLQGYFNESNLTTSQSSAPVKTVKSYDTQKPAVTKCTRCTRNIRDDLKLNPYPTSNSLVSFQRNL